MPCHKEVPVKVNALVDEGVADLVEALSEVPELVTLESCQGGSGQDAYVFFRLGDWAQCGAFLFGQLLPAMSPDLRSMVALRLQAYDVSTALGSITLDPSAVPVLVQCLRSISPSAVGQLPVTARDVIKWAVETNRTPLPEIDPYDTLANDLARALREEFATDEQGRCYHKNHAVRVTKGGVQHTFWAIMGFAEREHMQMAFAQRREQIIGDCAQLKTDVDVYNDMNKNQPAIQLVLDFTDDVAEREAWRGDDREAA